MTSKINTNNCLDEEDEGYQEPDEMWEDHFND